MAKRRAAPPCIRATATLETAARFMLFWGADRVEVFDDDGHPCGAVTERDLIRSIAHRHVPSETCVGELAEPQPREPVRTR